MTATAATMALSTSDIVGIVIGGVLGIATVIGLIFSCYTMCCKKNKPAQVGAEPNPYYPPYGQPPYDGYGRPPNGGYGQPPYGQPPNGSYGQPPNGAYGQPTNTGYYSQQPPSNKQPINNERPPSYSPEQPGRNPYGKH